MITVGVRELRQRASELLRRVQAGEVIEVTDHGLPVARLGPIPDQGPLERLRDLGELEGTRGPLDHLPDPLPLGGTQESPSRVLARLRSEER